MLEVVRCLRAHASESIPTQESTQTLQRTHYILSRTEETTVLFTSVPDWRTTPHTHVDNLGHDGLGGRPRASRILEDIHALEVLQPIPNGLEPDRRDRYLSQSFRHTTAG